MLAVQVIFDFDYLSLDINFKKFHKGAKYTKYAR